MFRTVKFKSASEGRFRTVLIQPDRTIMSQNSVLLGAAIPSGRRIRMMMAAFVVMSLSLLPTCRAYSITSSLGPSAFALLDVQNGPTPRVTSQGPPPPQSLPTVRRDTTAVPDLTSESVLLSSASLDSETEKSYVTRSADSEMSRTGSSHNNNNNNYSDDDHHQATASQTNHQHTRTQLQVAGRILFESRVTTPKPTFGYRAFLSSYRNPNYFVKKTKYSESSFIPNRSKNVYATSSSSSQTEEEEEDEEDEGEEEVVQDESLAFHSSFINLTTAKTFTSKSVKSPTPSSSTLYHQPKELTTAHSKTAPATSAYAASGRPSSTQQMQSDSPHPFPLNLSESESNNHYQYNNRDHQQWAGYVNEKRAVQIDPPTSTNRSASSRNPHDLSDGQSSRGDAVEGITAVPLGPDLKGPKEEPIIFPTTTSTQRTYKIPTHWLEEADLNGLKNLLGVRKGASEEVKPKEGESSTTSAAIEKFSPVPQGAKEPACAKNLGYCDIESFKDNYPKELLNSVLTNSVSSDFFRNVFGDDSEAGASAAPGSPDNFVLAGRNNINVNIPAEESALCGSQEVTIYPRVARNKDDKWMFIVNHDDYVQGVKVEKCMNEGSPCLFSEGNPLGYESVCRQKFILRKLVALNGEGKTALDTFKLPSCCVCYIKSSHVSNRIGISTSSASRTPVLSDKGSTGPSPIFGSSSSSSSNEGSVEVNDNNGPTGCTPFNIVPPKTTDSNNNNNNNSTNATSHTNNNSSSLVFSPTSPTSSNNSTSTRPLLS